MFFLFNKTDQNVKTSYLKIFCEHNCCEHISANIRTTAEIPLSAKNIPIGEKRKPGRPAKAIQALIIHFKSGSKDLWVFFFTHYKINIIFANICTIPCLQMLFLMYHLHEPSIKPALYCIMLALFSPIAYFIEIFQSFIK
ncbi:hypothetical protein BpHYR1_014001 [Brachionus plicatilis]|uniref:Uncharacterized protein n=1 Tax=Brachionus plicatilis TaxID=10195 RepID=A0A3M7QUB2_BRAPC|nr:hypothetical protein BpHYR1_014001 [Brachionus plicatilis]